MISYAYTILYVEDVLASIEFYESAFGCSRKFITPEKDYGELLTGATTIAFAQHQLAESNLPNGYQAASPKQKAFGIEIGFVCDDVQAAINKAVTAGATIEAPLKSKSWGQDVAYIRDLNGFLIELCTPMS